MDSLGLAGVQIPVDIIHALLDDLLELEDLDGLASFAPSKPEQYSQAVGKYINALLPVWMQYRDTYINLQEVLKSGKQ